MQTVPQTPASGKSFYCTFHDQPGVLTMPSAEILFLNPETGNVRVLAGADFSALIVLGEVDLAMQQALADMKAGWSAMIACSRQIGRS